MKFKITLLLQFVFLACIMSQELDELTTDKEVMIFVKKEFDQLKSFTLGIKCPEDENQFYLDSLEYSPWYVGDFNNDKIPDLFITGQEKKDQVHYLILGKDVLDEESKFNLISVFPPKNKGNLQIPFIEETKSGLMIIFRQFETKVRTETRNGQEVRVPRTYQDYYKMGLIKKDTLIYKFGGIVEFNPKPVFKDIRFIQLHSFCQYGVCPDYRMKIDSARNLILSNIKGTDQQIGKYAAICDEKLFKQIFELANYLKFNKSSQKFGEDSADHAITMIITYQDNSAVTWYDYEQGPTLAMSKLYDLLYEVKTTAAWEFKETDPD